MFSNTASPKYYSEFREAVLLGKTVVNREIAMEMSRIDMLIENPNIWYDSEAVESWIEYCEAEMVLTDGSPLVLLDSFKLWGEEIYGWYYFVNKTVPVPREDGHGTEYQQKTIRKRLTNKQYIILGRGGAKTTYLSCIQDYELNANSITTYQVAVAPTMRQADETLALIRTANITSTGPLRKFLTYGELQNNSGKMFLRKKLASTKKGIENFLSGSLLETRPLSIDKLQGLRTAVATLDEWLSGDIRQDPVGALEQGAAKVDDWIIVATSSEGTVRNGIGDTMKLELMKILRGEYIAPNVSIFYYKLDDIKEVGNPSMWVKAQPNIGLTVDYATYQNEVERAEKNPSVRNDILAKRFGIPCEGFTYFFTYEETLTHKQREFWNCPCALGADMSLGDDFEAFTFLFPLRDGFGIKTRAYITEDTFAKLPSAIKQKYSEFMDDGSLYVMPGVALDSDMVYEDLDRYIQTAKYDVRALGYDPYNARRFVERWEQDNGPFGIEKVIQGSKTESVPLGELKKLAENRMLFFDQPIMQYCLQNCIAIEDTNGNRKLQKRKHEQKIDCVAALLDAYIAFKSHKDQFD